jgi:hypothetical protein
MVDIFEDDKMIFKKEVFLSILGWSVLGYAFILVLNLIGVFILGLGAESDNLGLMVSSLGLGLLFFTLIPSLILAIIFYVALKKNWQKFGLIKYKFKITYLSYIFVFMMIFDVILNLILTGKLKLPQFGLLSLIILFIIPGLIKTESKSG